MTKQNVPYWVKKGLCLYVSVVFVQSLFFKFTGAPETVHIFGILAQWSGIGLFASIGAYSVGLVELLASCLLWTKFRLFGAIMAVGTMSGAVFFHLFTPLGIYMPEFDAEGIIIGNDGGLLFINACMVLSAAVAIALMEYRGSGNHCRSEKN